MKVNRILFDKLKKQWEILQASAALSHADQKFIEQTEVYFSENGMDPKQFFEFETDGFGNVRNVSSNEKEIQRLEAQIKEIEDQSRKLLEEEKYLLLQEMKEIWTILKKKLKTLKSL